VKDGEDISGIHHVGDLIDEDGTIEANSVLGSRMDHLREGEEGAGGGEGKKPDGVVVDRVGEAFQGKDKYASPNC